MLVHDECPQNSLSRYLCVNWMMPTTEHIVASKYQDFADGSTWRNLIRECTPSVKLAYLVGFLEGIGTLTSQCRWKNMSAEEAESWLRQQVESLLDQESHKPSIAEGTQPETNGSPRRIRTKIFGALVGDGFKDARK